MAKTGGKSPGIKDDVIGVIYQRLQAASDVDQYIQDAEQQGDREVVEFLRDYQESQKDLAERAKNLLGARMARNEAPREARVQPGKKLVVDAEHLRKGTGAPTNAQMKSGGQAQDDIVDEQSKESFPASDSPAKY
ncbi:hypothetical protein D187_001766 [Cystobacter fuscus DSM 2262]|uniref:Uncharacterized protein n=1 Tax=Cystobacter fuscus (strain ATCC 25194 / DSM 2262 / NBRC 100088 / M29) TaxID=1242864 RepID=S9PE76_CYSF2|nr:hypothetical protein [Cystobacter fuscus]EPX60612.1 hypothetical protein D187_001766 [Cystobacter fuscus DSM 2262]